jgi:hypothetical protein
MILIISEASTETVEMKIPCRSQFETYFAAFDQYYSAAK